MYILVDIGGTKIRIAISKNLENIDDIISFSTVQNYQEGSKIIEDKINELVKGKKIISIVFGLPGRLNVEKSEMVGSRNLREWIKKPIREEMEKKFNTKVFLENDTDLVGLGEAAFGAGKGKRNIVYITVSTGVGGAKIINGEIDKNSPNFEPGCQIIDAGRSLCLKSCAPYDLQSLISGAGILARTGKKPEKITDEKFWDEIAEFLAYGINNTIMHTSPNIVILGGSIMVNKISLNKVKKYLTEIFTSSRRMPEIVLAKLGDKGGIYGGMRYLQIRKENIFYNNKCEKLKK